MKKMALLALLYWFYRRLKASQEGLKSDIEEKKGQKRVGWKNMAIATFGRYKRRTPHKNAGFVSSLKAPLWRFFIGYPEHGPGRLKRVIKVYAVEHGGTFGIKLIVRHAIGHFLADMYLFTVHIGDANVH